MERTYPNSIGTKEGTSVNEILHRLDWYLLLITLLLIILGIVLIYSATSSSGKPLLYLSKQLIAVIIGLIMLVLFSIVNYRIYKEYYLFVYAVSILLLIGVLLFGITIRGTRGWFDFHYVLFQPSEVAKILFILSVAAYLDRNPQGMLQWYRLFVPIIFLLSHIGLILMQPDLSSALVYLPVLLSMLYCANTRIRHLSGIVLFGSVTIFVPLTITFFQVKFEKLYVVKFFVSAIHGNWLHMLLILLIVAILLAITYWLLRELKISISGKYFIFIFVIIILGTFSAHFVSHNIKEYQQKRLIAFIDPNIDPTGMGYNITQSKIAIGSGRLFGKGLFNGTQSQLGFLPAQHTDFIFSLCAEELGFVFSVLLLVGFLFIIRRAIFISQTSGDYYGLLVSIGISTMFAFQVVTNIGMQMGLTPIVGLPLPFISYGGSSMISSLLAIGLLESIYLRRFII